MLRVWQLLVGYEYSGWMWSDEVAINADVKCVNRLGVCGGGCNGRKNDSAAMAELAVVVWCK